MHGPGQAIEPDRQGALLERERELGALDRAVRAAYAGEAVLGLIEGPAGIGKSQLLVQTRELARSCGFHVLTARGSDLERELPYGIVRQLFEPLLLDAGVRERLLSGSATAAARVFDPLDAGGDSAAPGGFAALHGLFWLTANLAAERPLCLEIDDLHWSDSASLRFLIYLAHRLEGLGVMIVAAARMQEPDADSRLILELAQDPATVSVRLAPLTADAVATLVRDRLSDSAEPAFCAACHRATGGNPLLLGELLKTMRADGVQPDAAHAAAVAEIGPRAVGRTVLLRLARLPPDAIAVARAIAVLGESASLPVTASLAGIDQARAAEATRTLVAAEILRPEAPPGFVHALVRDAVYHELSAFERGLEHERAAKALAELGAAPEVLAGHLLLVAPRGDPWVAGLLSEAARLATLRADAESAAAYLARALDETPAGPERTQLLFELGAAESRFTSGPAIAHLREACEGFDDPRQRIHGAENLARMLMLAGEGREMVSVAQTAIAQLANGDVDQRRALEAIELYGVSLGVDVPDAAARLTAAREPDGLGHRGGRLVAAVSAWQRALGGDDADGCCELALGALADGALVAQDAGFGAGVAGSVLVLAGRDEAMDVWDQAMAVARRRGSVPVLCATNIWRGWTWLERGELIEAESSLREARQQLGDMFGSDGLGTAYVAAYLGLVLTERGDLDGARTTLVARGRPEPGSDGDALLRRAEIELLLAERRWEEALSATDAYRSRLRNNDNPAWAPWRSLRAQALDGLDRRAEASALAEEELDAARRWGAPGPVARALRVLGTSRRAEGHTHLREAVAVAEASSAHLEHAKALVALGAALRRAGQRAQSREPLRRGFELATRGGATPLGDAARAELYSAGGRPRRDALSGPGSLTPSERRVAELAAEGSSNREIAQTLYVTPKTVEVHLTSVYRKLGITSRARLAATLGAGAP